MNGIDLTPEMLEKAKNAAGADELIALAMENGVTLEHEEAQKLFAALHRQENGELGDAELDKIAGGRNTDSWYKYPC